MTRAVGQVLGALQGAALGLVALAAALVGAAVGAAASALVAGFLWLVVGGGDPRAPRALVALLEGAGALAGAALAVLALSAPCRRPGAALRMGAVLALAALAALGTWLSPIPGAGGVGAAAGALLGATAVAGAALLGSPPGGDDAAV